MYVRDLVKDPQYVDEFRPLGDILEKLKVSRTFYVNDVEFHVVDLVTTYEITKIEILSNDSRNLYVYNK